MKIAAKVILSFAILVTLGMASGLTQSNYPSRRIELIVANAAGSPTDLMSRALAAKLSEKFGQPVIVTNKAGAGNFVGGDAIARSAPDGYTFGIVGNTLTVYHLMAKDTRLIFQRDLAPITIAADGYTALMINPKLDVQNLADFISLAKKNPGKLKFASAGLITATYTAYEWFKSVAGIDMVHVPFAGSPAAELSVLSGDTDSMILNIANAKEYADSKRARILATTNDTRDPEISNVPTMSESGIPIVYKYWLGFVAPAGTPPEIINILNREITVALKDPDIMRRLKSAGLNIVGDSPSSFAKRIDDEIKTFSPILANAQVGVK